MRKMLFSGVLLAVLVLFSAQIASAQQYGIVSYSISLFNGTPVVTISGQQFVPYAPLSFSRSVVSGGCYQFPNGTWSLGNISSTGTFVFSDQVCDGVYVYSVTAGSQHTQFTVSVGNVQIPTLEPSCGQGFSVAVGMQVATTKSVYGWMEPNMGAHSYGGEPIARYVAGTALTVIQGPICNEHGIWWRVSKRFSFDHYGEKIFSETVAWVLDETNGSKTLFHLQGTPSESIIYPLFGYQYPEAVSVMSIQGQRVFDNPTLYGSRVAALKTANGLVPVIGTNASGTFLKIRLPSGKEGWICSHLTVNNVSSFYVPVLDQSANECYRK